MGVPGTAHQEPQRIGQDLDSASSFSLCYGILDLGGWHARVPEERPGKLSSTHKALWLGQGQATRDGVREAYKSDGRIGRIGRISRQNEVVLL
jgi:hypothetical protein